MNRIYYQGSFKLATDWPVWGPPHAPNQWAGITQDDLDSYEEDKKKWDKAIASAMENGVKFESQDKVKHYVFAQIPNYIDYKFKDGDNWDCPENVEIKEKCQHNGIHNSTCIYSKVAILKSENVEKKEKRRFAEEKLNL